MKATLKYIFEKKPELKKIGNKTQYLNYLKTIFPHTKLNKIACHHSNKKIEKFKDGFVEGYAAKHGVSKKAIFFLEEPTKEEFLSKRPHLIFTKLNLERPFIYKNKFRKGTKDRKAHSGIKEGIDYAIKNKYDSVIFNNIWDNRTWCNVVSVFSSKQIHIIGSKKDIKGFAHFLINN